MAEAANIMAAPMRAIPPNSGKDLPIIFSKPMIGAMLDGRKTMTRRVIKARPYNCEGATVDISVAPSAKYMRGGDGRMYFQFDHPRGGPLTGIVAHFAPGDRLWVRETWKPHSIYADKPPREIPISNVFYLADDDYAPSNTKWVPSIYMPRWASRLTLLVESVKVERLQDISEADARAEGWPGNPEPPYQCPHPKHWFKTLWLDLNGKDSWALNPWCAAISFRVIKANIDSIEAANV